MRWPVLSIATMLAMTAVSPANKALAQCYPGLACPPAAPSTPAAPSSNAPEPSPRIKTNPALETYRVLESVSGGVLNMRSAPSVTSQLVVAIPGSSKGLEVFRCKPAQDGASKFDWCAAKWQGYEGWISSCCILGEQSNQRPRTD